MEEIIKRYVELFEQKYNDSSSYNSHLEGTEKINLAGITEKEVEDVIKPFLYKWGKMGRVLGRVEFQDWRGNLAEQIRSNYERLKEFKAKDLADVDLSKLESDIEKCYESLKEAVGRIGAAKVLHLICPSFFPLWDNDIAKAIRSELGEKREGSKKVEDFSGLDYYRFMQKIQNLIKKYEKVLSVLSTLYKKGKLKILDECLWWATHRPLSLFL